MSAKLSAIFERFDDLTVVSGDPERPHTFTLTGIVHNEMHFLPAFLPHYRALGVDRFMFIDDQSDDGSKEYLAEQPDVVVLASNWRFGDRLTQKEAGHPNLVNARMDKIWRNLLLRKFCLNVWSLHLDADEFLDLPAGMTIQQLVARMEQTDIRAVWSVMLDMYPARIEDLFDMTSDKLVDFKRDWYFDGRRHLKLRNTKAPKVIYGGVRARLMLAYGLNPKANWIDRNIAPSMGLPPKTFNNIRKPVLLRFCESAGIFGPHSVSLPASREFLLPLRHYKFNGVIAQKIQWAIETKSHASGSTEYFALEKLLAELKQGGKPLLGPFSTQYCSFEDFRQTGNALGFS
jgi:hypothetical protein